LRKGSSKLKLQITIDGKAYAVEVEVLEDEESQPVEDRTTHPTVHSSGAHTPMPGGTWDAATKICRSPVMGLVIKVNVKPGQAVQADELMMVLEAMKMETNITAPRSATVKSVHVAPSGSVKVNQVLIEFE
jgi:methylmalonyl-CoA carboxyltransferase small subunit